MINNLSGTIRSYAVKAVLALSCLLSLPSHSERLRTMKVMKEGDFMAAPSIRLDSDERIIVTFDEWSEDYSDLQYRLVHCGPDWKPSGLLESEYLDGFNIADIEDWAFSSNTFVHYVNYRIELPNEYISPLLSGNYILEIFERDNPDETIGEARFSVSEHSAGITGGVSSHTDRGLNTEWQQLELRIEPTDVTINDPYSMVRMDITQNGTPYTTSTLRTPSRVEGKSLVYSHQPELIFKAGNEFRRFETIRTNYNDMHVDSMRFLSRNYHTWLTPDRERDTRQYSYDQTQQGRFLVREYNSTDSDLGADYVTVHFRLDTPEAVDADVYVEGEFTGWRHEPSTRMRYDYDQGAYLLEIPLKQGSYNYRYTAVPRRGERRPDPSIIEGNKHETRNEYRVQVWFRPPGARYDRLIADELFYSK
ncbi:MAG: DUF5103 domain-containing protein [Muribaculaceae bacterium]|nr:DUF5103 domain-containing protein [Muribaculaceae bacterium]